MAAERWGRLRYAPIRGLVDRRQRRGNQATSAQIGSGSGEFGLEPRSLVQYVLISRVDLLCERAFDGEHGWIVLPEAERFTRDRLAEAIGWTPKALSMILGQPEDFAGDGDKRGHRAMRGTGNRLHTSWDAARHSSRREAKKNVARLEADLHMFAIRERGATTEALHSIGSVSTFWEEMLGSGETEGHPSAHTARWYHDLVECGPRNSAEALVAGNALLSLLASARDRDDAILLLEAHSEQVTRTVRALMTVATKPPARGAVPAIHLLAQLGSLPVQGTHDRPLSVGDLVVEHVRTSPVGFRAVRILTRITTLSIPRYGLMPSWWSDGGTLEREMAWVALTAISDVEDRDPYPARSLWVEAMRAVRLSKSRYAQQSLSLLEERAKEPGRPTRERAYAAYCVFLALRDIDASRIRKLLRSIRASDANGEPADDGLVFAAKVIELLTEAGSSELTLERLILDRMPVPAEDIEPTIFERFSMLHEAQTVDAAVYPGERGEEANDLEEILDRLPASVRAATQSLIRYALLSIDGSARRRAAEALREGGVAIEAACVLISVLNQNAPRWLHEHAAFLLGYLTDPVAIDPLRAAAHGSKHQSIRHSAIWALGDIAYPDRDVIDDLLVLARRPAEEDRIRRAVAYALAVLHPEPDAESADEVLNALTELSRDDERDPLTADLARWGLLDRERARARREAANETGLWGIAPDLTAVLGFPLPPASD